MARIKISLPEQFSFTTSIPVRITDLNYGGHVGNDALLGIIHEARLQFLADLGYTEMDMEGTALIMADVAIEFKNEIFYGDRLLTSVTAGDFSRVGFDLYYKLEKKAATGQVPVAFAKTGMICFDYVLKKVTQMPTKARKNLGG